MSDVTGAIGTASLPHRSAAGRLPIRTPDGAGVVAARRLVRDIESLEASFAAAEQAVLDFAPSRRGFDVKPAADVDSRRAALERWEMELQDRERLLERERIRVEQIQQKLHRAKESLKRAIFRFRAEVAERTEALTARADQLARTHIELNEARRELAREQIRHKAAHRQATPRETTE